MIENQQHPGKSWGEVWIAGGGGRTILVHARAHAATIRGTAAGAGDRDDHTLHLYVGEGWLFLHSRDFDLSRIIIE